MCPLAPARTASRLPLILLLACLSLLTACGSLPQFGKPGGAGSGGGTVPAASHGPEQVYFAGQDDLKVYQQASARSTIVGQLALHQRVLRSEISKGYARIRTPDDQLHGWVDNARLIWRLPETTPPSASESSESPKPDASTAAPATAPAAAPAPEAQPAEAQSLEAQPAASAPAPIAPDAGGSPAPAQTPATDAPAEMPAGETADDTSGESAGKPKPSVFDSF